MSPGPYGAPWLLAIALADLVPSEVLPERVPLRPGGVALLLEDRATPLVAGRLLIRGGTRDVPPEKAGLAEVLAAVLNRQARSGGELARQLRDHAVELEWRASSDWMALSWSCPSETFSAFFRALSTLILDPRVPDDLVTAATSAIVDTTRQTSWSPILAADREALRLAYGAGSPYARQPTFSTLSRITGSDLASWRERWFRPGLMTFGLAGDFERQPVIALLEGLPVGTAAAPAATKTRVGRHKVRPGIYGIPWGGLTRSSIRVVSAGIRRDDPDYYAALFLSEIFGGGPSSRLFARLRAGSGLAYRVQGGIGAFYDRPGALIVSTEVRASAVRSAVDAILDEMRALASRGVTDTEFERARSFLLNSLPVRFATPASALVECMALEFHGRGTASIAEYVRGLDAVRRRDVDRAARRYLKPERAAIVIVAEPNDLSSASETWKPLTILDTLPAS